MNESWRWVVEEEASLPDPIPAGGDASDEPSTVFWDWLFEQMAAVGLKVYKLDHSQQQMPNMQSLLTRIGATEKWLRGMAIAAARHGISYPHARRAKQCTCANAASHVAAHARCSA